VNDILTTIDAALATATGDPISDGAMRWQPAVADHQFAALLIPADPHEAIRLVDLGGDAYAGARQHIDGNIGKHTVDEAGAISTDVLFDEDHGPDNGADPNRRATFLVHALKMAQLTGEYPAPAGVSTRDLAEEAALWSRYVHLYGPVVIVGADERTGQWVPVPPRVVEFATEALDLEEAP
jgi:hypothetical protein